MKVEQISYSQNGFEGQTNLGTEAQWVLVFGSGELINDNTLIDKIRDLYPNAYIMGCSSAGEIKDRNVVDDTLCITAVAFQKSRIIFKSYEFCDSQDSFYIGKKITSEIPMENLKQIFILSEGVNINGSKLVEGMRTVVGNSVPITGGLAGDGSHFKITYVLDNGYAKTNHIVAAAIYGDIETGCASVGGWSTFGIERQVTKSKDNILYEVDGKPALELYKKYLGEKSKELPASALLFPLSVRNEDSTDSYVRTILAINEKENSLVFAGDVPVNSYCKLMRSSYNSLVNGAKEAAILSKSMVKSESAELAILISCLGRKLVLKQCVDEEIEIVRDVLGENVTIAGFYSYGEIAPYKNGDLCELHNQTMTITLISEE